MVIEAAVCMCTGGELADWWLWWCHADKCKKYSIGPYNTKWWQRFHQPLLMDSFAYMPSIPPIYFSSIRIWDNRFTSIKLNRHLRDRCPGLKPRPRLKQRMLMHCAILACVKADIMLALNISQLWIAFSILKVRFLLSQLTLLSMISIHLVHM